LDERFLITGALGCIGAWAAALLAREGVPVTTLDIGADRRRLASIMTKDELLLVQHVVADLTDLGAVERVLDEHEITNVIHLAAMLIPLAKADPPRGAHVNVVGTVNVFEAVKDRRERIPGLAYASSAAVYDIADGKRIDEDADGHPVTHYGVHKLANEGTARVYWRDDGVASIGLRPYIVYGPGRDTGLTAGPTLAIAAAVRGEPYHIGFGGVAQYHYAPDAAAAFISAAREAREGALVANLGGPPLAMSEFVGAIAAAVPAASGLVTFEDVELAFPEEFGAELRPAPVTPIEVGVRETADHFRRELERQ
jgi:nucleoside-diphosphate-sugar epimerase